MSLKTLVHPQKNFLYNLYRTKHGIDIWGDLIFRRSLKTRFMCSLLVLFTSIISGWVDQNKKDVHIKFKRQRLFLYYYTQLSKRSREYSLYYNKSVWFITKLHAEHFRLYYNNLRVRDLRKMISKFSEVYSLKYKSFVLLFETRLDTLLYRLHLLRSFRESRQLVLYKNVIVNGKIINSCSYTLKRNDVMSVKFDLRAFFLIRILRKFKQRSIYYNYPIYYEVNWTTLSITPVFDQLDFFSYNHVPFMIEFDLEIAFNHYNI